MRLLLYFTELVISSFKINPSGAANATGICSSGPSTTMASPVCTSNSKSERSPHKCSTWLPIEIEVCISAKRRLDGATLQSEPVSTNIVASSATIARADIVESNSLPRRHRINLLTLRRCNLCFRSSEDVCLRRVSKERSAIRSILS